MAKVAFGGRPRPKDQRDFKLGDYQAPALLPEAFMQDVSAIPVKMQGTFGTCGAHAGSFFDSKLQTDNHLMSAVRYALSMFAGAGSMYDLDNQRRDDRSVAEMSKRLTQNDAR